MNLSHRVPALAIGLLFLAHDKSGLLAKNKCFFIPTDNSYLLGVLNPPLMWWHNFRYFPYMKDEALSPVTFKMEVLPIALPPDDIRASVETAVRQLIEQTGTLTVLAAGWRIGFALSTRFRSRRFVFRHRWIWTKTGLSQRRERPEERQASYVRWASFAAAGVQKHRLPCACSS